jgi:Carboxypeptidase regulatory-like domain
MDRRTWVISGLVCLLLAPVAALGQQAGSGVAGVVRDTSGAVLPGVTVEAASPALIEKVRGVVTDGAGRYAITDLRPGTYAVTFTLAGFKPLKREGIALTAAFTATVNADLAVGGVEETITVSGEPAGRCDEHSPADGTFGANAPRPAYQPVRLLSANHCAGRDTSGRHRGCDGSSSVDGVRRHHPWEGRREGRLRRYADPEYVRDWTAAWV